MNKKLFFILILGLTISSFYGQKDSTKSKHQLFFSFNVGLPIYNSFDYRNEQQGLPRGADSKRKPSLNLNFEHNIEHFTINLLFNYSFNEFNGDPYYTWGKYIHSYNNQEVYRSFEVYQTIKYNYLQAGLGLGYNHWIKKHNIALTANLQKKIFTDIIVSTNYTTNSYFNNQDTSQIQLPKNFRPLDIEKNRDLYLNMKLMYTYALTNKLCLSLSISASYGLLQTYSPSVRESGIVRDDKTLAYGIYTQKMLYSNLGIRYKLY
ncbi:MAG: hypothetical protein V4677_10780 [Bacteroidota bacterium]